MIINKTEQNNRTSERGNVFIIIMVAIILFVALSYTVSNMMNTGNADTISDQQAEMFADAIVDYGRGIRQAVQDLRINGCADTDISFENNIATGYSFVSRDECEVFNINGGAMNYIRPDVRWMNESFSTLPVYREFLFHGATAIQGMGTTSGDLTMNVWAVTDKICEAVNERAGITGIPEDLVGPTRFTGAYSSTGVLGDDAAVLAGKPLSCWRVGTGMAPPFYVGANVVTYVLLAR